MNAPRLFLALPMYRGAQSSTVATVLESTPRPRPTVMLQPRYQHSPCPCGSGKRWSACHGADDGAGAGLT